LTAAAQAARRSTIQYKEDRILKRDFDNNTFNAPFRLALSGIQHRSEIRKNAPMKFLAALLLTAGLVLGSRAGSADDYPAVPLLSGSQTVVGENVVYPTTGKAVVTAMIVTLAPGEKTVVHRHGV